MISGEEYPREETAVIKAWGCAWWIQPVTRRGEWEQAGEERSRGEERGCGGQITTDVCEEGGGLGMWF